MSRHLDRLRRGERWWAAEVVLRAMGLLLLASCYRLATFAHRLVTTRPPHQATLGEFAVCLGVVVSLTCGLALTMFGPKLFEHVPVPTRNALYWKDR